MHWHQLPELPPRREPTERHGRFIVEPTDRVMVKAPGYDRPEQAIYHHGTREFWTVGTIKDHRIVGVTEWAFQVEPTRVGAGG